MNTSSNKSLGEEDVLIVDQSKKNKSIKVSKEMKQLEKAANIADSSVPFTQVKAFIPAEKNSGYLNIQDNNILYLKPQKGVSIISGSLVFENNTENPMEVQSLFFQGKKIAQIKLSSSSIYNNVINYTVPPFTSSTIEIDLKVNLDGDEEIIFLPLDFTATKDFYNGANLAISRFFLDLGKKKEINDFKEHTFTLSQQDLERIENIFPVPYWVDEDKKDIKMKVEDNSVATTKKISKLKLAAIPYETKVDILIIDEFGNSSVLKNDVRVIKDKDTFVSIEDDIINELYNNQARQFLILLNNREEELITDLKAMADNKKPFPTTFNSIIEFYKNIEQKDWFLNHSTEVFIRTK